LLTAEPGIQLSISHTTRTARPGEENDRDYHFCSHGEFAAMVDDSEFFEHAEVFGNWYGTSRAEVFEALNVGTDVLLEIDFQGAQQIREVMRQAVSIFIAPPSREVLLSRLIKRNQDSPEVIARRTLAARQEIEHYKEFDFLIINDSFDEALKDLIAIVRAQRLRTATQAIRHRELMQALLR